MTHFDLKTTFKKRRGVAMIIVMILMTAALGASLSIAELFIRELKINSDIRFSTQAFYAAETGIEQYLWEGRRNGLTDQGTYTCSSSCLGNSATYTVTYDLVSATNIISVGNARGIRRALEVVF